MSPSGPSGSREGLLFGLLAALTLAAAAAVALDARPRADREERAEQFHRLVGGLGFGPALDLDGCEFGFDPRLCPDCGGYHGPVPGGGFFCPHHAGSDFDYLPLPDAPPP